MSNDTKCEPCGGAALPDEFNAARGCFGAIIVAAVLLALMFLLCGCSTVRPLSEYQHVSHASDGLGGPGFDTLSLGIRWRPVEGVQVDLLEGYSPNGLDGQQEIFTGRVTVEF